MSEHVRPNPIGKTQGPTFMDLLRTGPKDHEHFIDCSALTWL